MNEDTFYIPVDNAEREFLDHLHANPRTIFSSKFGDGKSFFLDKLRTEKFATDEFEFLTIYPVNYQVASNKDIFDFIKRDILFQLLIHDMMSDRIIVRNDIAMAFYLQNNGISLIQDLLPYLAVLDMHPKMCTSVLLAMKGVKLFQDLTDKFHKFKEQRDEGANIESFIKQVNSSYVYEDDIITYIIKKTIDDYKARKRKQIVLLIEDLDRLDPAHLFRILNVFSAHMDMCYKVSLKPDTSLVGNKFNLDNVVLVVDYSNVEKIFHHIYGPTTDFSGYISKFTSSKPFCYSIHEERGKYILEELKRVTGAPEEMIQNLIPLDGLDTLSLRSIVSSFKIENQIAKKPIYIYQNQSISLDITILNILSVLIRMNVAQEEIDGIVLKLYKQNKNLFFTYVAPYYFVTNDNVEKGLRGQYLFLNDRRYIQTEFVLDIKTGKCDQKQSFYDYNKKEGTNLIILCKEIQRFVVK